MLNFDANRPPATPKDAATVVVVRQTGEAVELFCVKRHARSGFLGGAVVFPGGKVDASDRAQAWDQLTTTLSERARQLAQDEAGARTFAVAALRETLEEAAILPVAGDDLDDAAAQALRDTLERRYRESDDEALAFAELLRERGLRVDTGKLEALSRWITPEAESRRYDTRFYVLPAPANQSGSHDQKETTSSFWATPEAVLERCRRGEIFLAPPTMRTIELFRPARSIDDVLRITRTQSLSPVCPHFVFEGQTTVLALPGDPLYPKKHPAPEDPSAPTRFVLEDGRFVGRRA